jgi:hypothetical protein
MHFSVLMFVIVSMITVESCNQGSVERLNDRVRAYHMALAEGRVGSEYWSQSYRRDTGDPEVVARKQREEIEAIRPLGPPLVTKSYVAVSNQTLGHSTTYVQIVGVEGRPTRRAKMMTTWAWLRDDIGFYDWYLVRIDDLIDVEDHEGPTGEAKNKGRVEHSPHGRLF